MRTAIAVLTDAPMGDFEYWVAGRSVSVTGGEANQKAATAVMASSSTVPHAAGMFFSLGQRVTLGNALIELSAEFGF